MVKSVRKSETETFGIVGRFHRFEDLAGKRVHVPILNIQGKKETCIWGKNGKRRQNWLKTDKNKPDKWSIADHRCNAAGTRKPLLH